MVILADMVAVMYNTYHQRAAVVYLVVVLAVVASMCLITCYMSVTCRCVVEFSDLLHALLAYAVPMLVF